MMYRVSITLMIALLSVSLDAMACPVCFGNGEEHTGAVNLAIATLLAATSGIFGAIGWFVYNMHRRTIALAQSSTGDIHD